MADGGDGEEEEDQDQFPAKRIKLLSPLVELSVNLAEAIWCLDEDKPKWQQCVIASAIATRLGLTTEGVDTEFELSKIPDSFQDKSYRALKEFFKNQQNLPPWFSQ